MKSFCLINIFAVLLFCFNVSGTADDEPDDIYKIIRLNQSKTSETITLRKFYYPSYYVNVNIQNPACDWLNCIKIIDNDELEEYLLTIKSNCMNYPDKRVEFQTSEISVKDENGNPGEFDPDENTDVTEPPADRIIHWIVQWDACPQSRTTISQVPQLPVGIPESTADTYILFGQKDSNATTNNEDQDYFRFMPTEASGTIYMAFPNGAHGSRITVQLEQEISNNNNNNSTITVPTTFLPSGASFKPTLEFTNLVSNVTAYIKISFENYDNTQNLNYQLAVFTCNNISETIDWTNDSKEDETNGTDGDKIAVKNDSQPIFISFNSLSDAMSFQTYTMNSYSICFYNEQFERIFTDLGPQINVTEKLVYNCKRYAFTDLNVGEKIFIKLTIDTYNENKIKWKLSRVKPIILIHGIDALPRHEGDGTSFGDLKKSDQYFDIRPYISYDFPWDSMKSIKGKYVGANYSQGILGKYIASKRNSNDLKATIVAHSAGCLMTYYFCQEQNVQFKNNIDSIIFAAPPMLGSSLANVGDFTKYIAVPLKRTSKENFDLLARGTKANWDRGKTPFAFSTKKTSVLVGTRKNITLLEVGINSIKPLKEYKNLKLLFSTNYFWRSNIDIWYDVFANTIEGVGEKALGLEAMWPAIINHSHELHKRNISDSAVGIYSANLVKNPNFRGINTKTVNQIHSKIQDFSENNEDLYETFREHLKVIEVEE